MSPLLFHLSYPAGNAQYVGSATQYTRIYGGVEWTYLDVFLNSPLLINVLISNK